MLSNADAWRSATLTNPLARMKLDRSRRYSRPKHFSRDLRSRGEANGETMILHFSRRQDRSIDGSIYRSIGQCAEASTTPLHLPRAFFLVAAPLFRPLCPHFPSGPLNLPLSSHVAGVPALAGETRDLPRGRAGVIGALALVTASEYGERLLSTLSACMARQTASGAQHRRRQVNELFSSLFSFSKRPTGRQERRARCTASWPARRASGSG